MRNIGIVTNCWNFQLQNGHSLRGLIAQAADLQMRDIELRQGSLGDLEPTVASAHLDELKAIVHDYPHCRFDYAMSFSFFGGAFDYRMEDLQLGQEVAVACGRGEPHLRLVDVTSDNATARQHFDVAVECLAALADDLDTQGVRLTIEHSYQTWDLFWPLFAETRARSASGNVWLCFDPANFSLANESEKIDEVVSGLDTSIVSMLHVKQADQGVIETELGDGEVHWPSVVRSFLRANYTGPVMFEFVSSPEVERVTLESLQKWQHWIESVEEG